MRRKKFKPLPKIPCLHCLVFQDSKRMLDGGRLRFCKFLKQDIFGDELRASSCDNFQPSLYFWCDRSQQRISINVCLHRKESKFPECKRCKAHAVILEVKKRENGQVETSWRKACRQPVCKSWRNKGERNES